MKVAHLPNSELSMARTTLGMVATPRVRTPIRKDRTHRAKCYASFSSMVNLSKIKLQGLLHAMGNSPHEGKRFQ
jgi:hypothetical protein